MVGQPQRGFNLLELFPRQLTGVVVGVKFTNLFAQAWDGAFGDVEKSDSGFLDLLQFEQAAVVGRRHTKGRHSVLFRSSVDGAGTTDEDGTVKWM